MSTYLLAFVIGEFNYIETNEFCLPIRVFATPDKNIEHGRFSLELVGKTLSFMRKLLTVNTLYRKWTWFLFPTSALELWRIGA